MSDKQSDREKKIQIMQHVFYMDVYSYLKDEYRPQIARWFCNSPIAGNIVDLVNEYYWGGNSVPFVAGQIADLLNSKYKKKR